MAGASGIICIVTAGTPHRRSTECPEYTEPGRQREFRTAHVTRHGDTQEISARHGEITPPRVDGPYDSMAWHYVRSLAERAVITNRGECIIPVLTNPQSPRPKLLKNESGSGWITDLTIRMMKGDEVYDAGESEGDCEGQAWIRGIDGSVTFGLDVGSYDDRHLDLQEPF